MRCGFRSCAFSLFTLDDGRITHTATTVTLWLFRLHRAASKLQALPMRLEYWMIGLIFFTGGRGKTGGRAAARHNASGISSAVGARTAPGSNERRFDWVDLSSASAFERHLGMIFIDQAR